MSYYKNTTQVPNELIDTLMKTLPASEFKVLLLIIRRTTGMIDKEYKSKRVQRAWISQKLFRIACNLSVRAVSTAVHNLVEKKLIDVTDSNKTLLETKQKRRGKSRLFFASRLRLEHNNSKEKKKASALRSNKAMHSVHTIKLTDIKLSCDIITQGVKRLSDKERYQQLQKLHKTTKHSNTN